MSKNGDLLRLWNLSPSKTPSKKDSSVRNGNHGRLSFPRQKQEQYRAEDPASDRLASPSPFASSPPPPTAAVDSAVDIVMDIKQAPTTTSASQFRDMSPIPSSPLSSLGSFPASPVHASWKVSSPLRPKVVKASSPHVHYIRDSDDDDDDDDGSGSSTDPVESLQAALRFSQQFGAVCGTSRTSSTSGTSTSSYSSSIHSCIHVAGSASTTTTTTTPASNASKTSKNKQSSTSSECSSSASQSKRRRATNMLSSPLALRKTKQVCLDRAIQPPKHKFDMQALLRHAEQDDAAEAAAKRMSAVLARRDPRSQSQSQPLSPSQAKAQSAHSHPISMLDTFMDLDAMSGPGDSHDKAGAGDGQASRASLASLARNKERLQRAFDRTEISVVSEQWYFFSRDTKKHATATRTKRRPFPLKAAVGRWSILRDTALRRDYFSMGLVRRVLETAMATEDAKSDNRNGLPDDIFLWILNEAATETQPLLRAEYLAILGLCPAQVRRFVDEERLLQLFRQLNPHPESLHLSARLELVPTVSHPYAHRDWQPLRSLLSLLTVLGGMSALTMPAIHCASKVLLRLGMDTVVEEDVELLEAYQRAMRNVVGHVSRLDWDDYCHDVCSSLHDSVDKPSLRWQVVSCLPSDTPACHELRRRLASVFLLGDPAHARQDPRRTVVGGQGLAQLALRSQFVVAADTNYADLVGQINLLDVYVDDAGRRPYIQSWTAPGAAAFDADVDGLAQRLQMLGRSIEATSGGHVSRLESKTALDRLQIRLTHAVRTRRPGRRNIFDLRGGTDVDDYVAVPKQKDIRNFFSQKLAKKVGA